jgi:hypothetical protein
MTDYCVHCRERLVVGDEIVVMNNGEMLMHRNCALRGVVGSAAHILKICSCYVPGSTESDPPELSVREAANFAVELWTYEHERQEKAKQN